MIYLAGDNNLETYALKDLAEMSLVGSSTDVAIVAQLDRMADQITRRYFITSDQGPEANCIAEIDEINTGDPLVKLVREAVEYMDQLKANNRLIIQPSTPGVNVEADAAAAHAGARTRDSCHIRSNRRCYCQCAP